MIRFKLAATALLVAGVLGSAGCGGSSEAAPTVNVVGFSVLEQANKRVFDAFEKTSAGQAVHLQGSYGASGSQRDAVIGGQPADEVHLSLEPDVAKLVDAGKVAKSWDKTASHGICTDSVVIFAVQPGNPKHLESWSDLIRTGVKIITPDPGSSGSAKWNLLAAYGAARTSGGGDAAARGYMKKFMANVAAWPTSGRDATTSFENGTGDVLITYENEAILARQAGQQLDYVIPDTTLLIENPCAVTVGAPKAAKDLLAYQTSPAGQKLYASAGFRPLPGVDLGDATVKGATDPGNPFPTPRHLLTVGRDFGGWTKANTEFFDDSTGILTKLKEDTGR